MPADDASRTVIDQPWTDVCTHLVQPAGEDLRNRLCGLLLDELLQGVERFAADGFDPFAKDWNRWDALRGRQVCICSANETVSGTAIGISECGALLVDCQVNSGKTEVRKFFAGDVSIRSVEPDHI